MTEEKSAEIITEFDPELLNEKFFRMCILGGSYSGKSYFIKYIYKFIKKKYNEVFLFTPNFNEDFYEDFIYDLTDKSGNEKLTTHKYYTGEFEEVMTAINLIRSSETNKNLLIILDDIISNKATKNNEFMKLFASGRHQNISLIYCCQFFTHEFTNNAMRSNCNVIVCTRPSTIGSRNWIKSQLLQEAIMKLYPDDEDDEIKKKIIKYYNLIFKNKYDKIICYEDKLFKKSE